MSGSQMQERNAEMVQLLSADFQRRYEPNFAWKSACSQYLALPGLRGFWPMSSVNEAGNAYDLSGQGRILTRNGGAVYNYVSLAPYVFFDGTGDFLSRADEAGLDIVGDEAYIEPPALGLTLGGWFYREDDNAAGLIGKTDGTESYELSWGVAAAGAYAFRIWDAGAATDTVAHVDGDEDEWKFICGRFIPSTEIRLWIDAVSWTNTTGIPATLRSSTANLLIGATTAAPTNDMLGRASLCFLCATALGDGIVSSIYHQSRALFGK